MAIYIVQRQCDDPAYDSSTEFISNSIDECIGYIEAQENQYPPFYVYQGELNKPVSTFVRVQL